MNVISRPQDTIPASAPASVNNAPNSTPPAPFGSPDAIGVALGNGPLSLPLRRLARGLDALVASGELLGVELDLAHPDCPCFLLDVSPGGLRFYVTMSLDSLDDPEGGDETLLVLMNWMGRDTEPAAWETEIGDPDDTLDFGEVLGHVLWAAENPAES